jgi:DNA-binding PadR family transcriptional regulator
MRAWLKRRRWRADVLVLAALAAGEEHGYEISRRAGLRAARLYPALDRLEKRGVICSGWGEPVSPGGPRRRWYKLTSDVRSSTGSRR